MSKVILFLTITCVVLLVLTGGLYRSNEKNKEKYLIEINNKKALERSNEEQKLQFKLTLEELRCSADSLNQRINDLLKENKIKQKKIASLQYMLDTFSRTDSMVLKDTIFRDPEFRLDTLIQDSPYYNCKLSLQYPSFISISPSFTNEKLVTFSYVKETIKPRKKFFLCYWFQKKHIVCQIEVINTNPYIEGRVERFIEIIK